MDRKELDAVLAIKNVVELGYQDIYSDGFFTVKKLCNDAGIKELSVSPMWKYSWHRNYQIGWILTIGNYNFSYFNNNFDQQKKLVAQKKLMIGDKL
jgi:hypothetical protein